MQQTTHAALALRITNIVTETLKTLPFYRKYTISMTKNPNTLSEYEKM